jgi:D-alanyl-D-alanine dipeptidase
MKNKIFILSLFIFSLFIVTNFCNAQNDPILKATTTPTYSASSYELITPIGNISSVKDQDAGGLSGFFNLLIKIAIALAGAIAVLMVIVGGIQYLGTDSIWEKGESVSRMTGAIGGIILLLCSYTILYIINPDLVNIKIGMKKVSEGEWDMSAIATEQDSLVDNDTTHSTGQRICNSQSSCKSTCSTYCKGSGKNTKCNYNKTVPGVMDPNNAKKIDGIKNISAPSNVTASASVIEGLKKLSTVFDKENKGYSAKIISGYRPINRQLEIACSDLNKVPSYVAYPGGSNHGTGVAIDIYLEQNGSPISYCTLANSKKMDEMMTSAGWVRYTKEAWHYEYGTNTGATRCVSPNCPQAEKCGQ